MSSDKTIGILSIDIDGNDYWVMNAIDCVEAIILICEFNKNAPSGYIQPYEANFMWDRKSSAGSSLDAIIDLAKKKKYQFVGTDSSVSFLPARTHPDRALDYTESRLADRAGCLSGRSASAIAHFYRTTVGDHARHQALVGACQRQTDRHAEHTLLYRQRQSKAVSA